MPTIVENSNVKKVPNIKPLNKNNYSNLQFTNLSFPFDKPYGPKTFGSLTNQLVEYKNAPFKIPVPGEGLPRVLHYCADQSGCAFWRMIWPGDELLAHNKAVVMTLYQMVTLAQFYGGIDAVKLQRQCTSHQVEFIKFLRHTSDQMKKQTGKGFRIIYEIDDICCPAVDIPDYNVCKTAFEGDEILKNMTTAVHLCVDEHAKTLCSVDGNIMEITLDELSNYFKDKRNILIFSKNLETNQMEFKPLENIWVTSENAEVLEIVDDDNNLSLICTPEHPVYTKNRGWVQAKDLFENDLLDILE